MITSLNKNNIFKILLIILLVISNTLSANTEVSKLVLEAKKNNPILKAARENYLYMLYKVKQAGALPDPIISGGLFGERIQTKVGPQTGKVGISQVIPNPGKLSLKTKIAENELKLASLNILAQEREVIYEVKYYLSKLQFTRESMESISAQKKLLESMHKVARSRYEANLTSQQDIIKADVAITNLINKTYKLVQQESSIKSIIKKIIGLDKISLENKYSLSAKIPELDKDKLKEVVDKTNPNLLVSLVEIKKGKNEYELGKLRGSPNFGLGFDYFFIEEGNTTLTNDGKDAWLVSGKISLPIWFDQNDAQYKEKESNLRRQEHNSKSVKDQIYFKIEDIFYKIKSSQSSLNLISEVLLPQVIQSYGAAKSSYETGKTDFADWLETERNLLDTKLLFEQEKSNYFILISELEKIVGSLKEEKL